MIYTWEEFEVNNIVNNKLDTLKITLTGDNNTSRTAIISCAIDGQAGILEDISLWDRDRCIEYAEIYAESNDWKQSMLNESNNKVVF